MRRFFLTVKIRLSRGGRKKVARYRIVAADSRFPRGGRFLETLGNYNPQSEPKEFNINIERVGYWLKQGAKTTETVENLLHQDRFKEKYEAITKGLDVSTLNIERKPDRKRKPKGKTKKES